MESHHPDGDLRPDGSADCPGHHELHENAVDVKCKMLNVNVKEKVALVAAFPFVLLLFCVFYAHKGKNYFLFTQLLRLFRKKVRNKAWMLQRKALPLHSNTHFK